MRILIASDAWHPQVNGVVRSLETVQTTLAAKGHVVEVIGPDRFWTVPLPGYAEIRLALLAGLGVGKMITDFGPEAIHIATEGPLGWAARRWCVTRGLRFTTSFHTQFPEYVQVRLGIPLGWSYGYLRSFHAAAVCTMVATQTVETNLRGRGFTNLVRWSRGVDTDLFRPRVAADPDPFEGLARPLLLYVGRLAPEKNLGAFLSLETQGTKIVVGGGPSQPTLETAHPDVVFTGPKYGEELARHFAAADVFVFPSRTDTFGLVLLEALACGVPVAAFPVQGPLDVIGGTDVGVLDEDLGRAVSRALEIPRDRCRAFALEHSWDQSADQFLDALRPIDLDWSKAA